MIHGNMEKWGHGDLETWTWIHGDMDMETWRHGQGNMDIDT
jgi:hypothetical protein